MATFVSYYFSNMLVKPAKHVTQTTMFKVFELSHQLITTRKDFQKCSSCKKKLTSGDRSDTERLERNGNRSWYSRSHISTGELHFLWSSLIHTLFHFHPVRIWEKQGNLSCIIRMILRFFRNSTSYIACCDDPVVIRMKVGY